MEVYGAKYTNTVTFKPPKLSEQSDSDTVKIKPIPPTINKYVVSSSEEEAEIGDRSTLNWSQKNSDPAWVGVTNTKKTVKYTVVVENPNLSKMKGTFVDNPADGITITRIRYKKNQAWVRLDKDDPDGLILPKGQIKDGVFVNGKRTLEITAEIPSTTGAGKYVNVATYTPKGEDPVSSSDYIKITNPPKFKIKKYITKVESAYTNSEYDNYTPSNRKGLNEKEKEDGPVVAHLNYVKVHYTIEIQNTGDCKFKGNFKDESDAGFEASDAQTQNNITVKVGETKKINLVLTLNGTAGTKYKNTAKFTVNSPPGADPKTKSSSDWILIENPPPPPEIEKTISTFDGAAPTPGGRERTEAEHTQAAIESKELWKKLYPVSKEVDALTDVKDKVITYKVVITNNYTSALTGKFEDIPDNGITISSITNETAKVEIKSGDNVTIEAGGKVTITIGATIGELTKVGVYGNRSRFILEENPYYIIESYDYFEIKLKDPPPTGSLKKYISNITQTSGKYKPNRNTMNVTQKYANPGEVEKGSIVEFTVEATTNIHYRNMSAFDHSGNQCPDHSGYASYTLTCKDSYSSGLTYRGYSGDGKFNPETNTITWENVKANPDPNTSTVSTITLKFEVTASNMTLPNLENTVSGLTFALTRYYCYVNHGTNQQRGDVDLGPYIYCDHANCKFTCIPTPEGDTFNSSDSDYVRLLDPEIKGTVFLDKNKNNFMDENEKISSMSLEQYKEISVELWRRDPKVDANGAITYEGNGELVLSQKVNKTNGTFTFGRVRKGTTRTIASPPSESGNPVPDYYNIGVGNYFYYNNANLYQYYLIFNYDGERYIASDYAGMSNLNSSTYDMDVKFTETEINNMPEDSKFTKEDKKFLYDSNADEDGRVEFNKALETIANNKAYKGTTSTATKNTMSYDEDGEKLQVSHAKWNGNTESVLNMKAKTFNLYYSSGETEYLQNLNLGLKEREIADISLTKDLVSAEVTVNGYKTTYNYEKLGKEGEATFVKDADNTLKTPYELRIYREDYEYRTDNQPDPAKSILKGNNPYTSYDRDNDLQILLKFKITVKNESKETGAVLREIVDYYSNKMTVKEAKVGDTLLTVSTTSSFENNPAVPSDTSKAFYTGNGLTDVKLAPGGTLEISTIFLVNKNANGYIEADDIDGTTIFDGKFNIAEVGAYSFYELAVDEKGNKTNTVTTTPAGLVDNNSNPANLTVTEGKINTNKFEDDTFGTGILIEIRDGTTPKTPPKDPPGERKEKYIYRNISGIVFEDMIEGVKTGSDNQKVGDGVMESGDNDEPAKNVIVKLYEVAKGATEDYLIDTGLWYRTGDDGRYSFGDVYNPSGSEKESTDDKYRLHAGIYVVRFIYGDEADNLVPNSTTQVIRYSGQDFKSAKYTEVGTANSENEIIDPDRFVKISGNTTEFDNSGNPSTLGSKIVSVAKDNEVRRLQVNNYSTDMTYPMDTVLKASSGSDEMKILAANTSMFADTKMFNMDIEYVENYSDRANKIIDGTLTFLKKDGTKYTIENYGYSVRDINFGLIERPKTKLQLVNDIKEVRAITSDGKVLIDAFFDITYGKDEYGNFVHSAKLNEVKSIGDENVQCLNRGNGNQGFRYANVDSDLLQGMTVTVKFQIAVANIGEVDHLSSWLEDEIEARPSVDLKVSYITGGTSGSNSLSGGNNTETYSDQIREYTRNGSYLNDLLYSTDSGKLGKLNDGTKYPATLTYGTGTNSATSLDNSNVKSVSASVSRPYTFRNIQNVDSDYRIGSYLGNIYYNNEKIADIPEKTVRTRVDQFIDYVDNDLVFKPEENVDSEGRTQYLTYTTKEIGRRGLLRGITTDTKAISDGRRDYYNLDKPTGNNNLAFNIEDGVVNESFYKFMDVLPSEKNSSLDESSLYVLELQASKLLSSEMDIEGFEVENLAEIVKVANTAGRKVYVRAGDDDAASGKWGPVGFIGNTTKEPLEIYSTSGRGSNMPTSFVELARPETDTDFTEYVTLSPPTGLSKAQRVQNETMNALLIIVPSIIIVVGISYVVVQLVKSKKFYK